MLGSNLSADSEVGIAGRPVCLPCRYGGGAGVWGRSLQLRSKALDSDTNAQNPGGLGAEPPVWP
jgi:hypothetical protein